MNHHMMRPGLDDEDGPSAADLTAIEVEWPLIEAQIAVVDAEIAILTAGFRGPTDLDWRRLRRAEHQVLRAAAQLAATAQPTPMRPASPRAA
jgi:hypothetical protein